MHPEETHKTATAPAVKNEIRVIVLPSCEHDLIHCRLEPEHTQLPSDTLTHFSDLTFPT